MCEQTVTSDFRGRVIAITIRSVDQIPRREEPSLSPDNESKGRKAPTFTLYYMAIQKKKILFLQRLSYKFQNKPIRIVLNAAKMQAKLLSKILTSRILFQTQAIPLISRNMFTEGIHRENTERMNKVEFLKITVVLSLLRPETGSVMRYFLISLRWMSIRIRF